MTLRHSTLLRVWLSLCGCAFATPAWIAPASAESLLAESPKLEPQQGEGNRARTASTVATTEDVERYFRALERHFANREAERFLDGFAPSFEANFGRKRFEDVRASVDRLFTNPVARYELAIQSIETGPDFCLATVRATTSFGPAPDSCRSASDTAVWVLEASRSGELRATYRYSVEPESQQRLDGSVYTSPAGGYSLSRPDGWVLFVPTTGPRTMFDLVWIFHPASHSIMSIGVVDLPPRDVDAKTLAALERDNLLQDAAYSTEVLAFEPAKLAGREAWISKTASRIAGAGSDFEIVNLKMHNVRDRLYTTVSFQANTRALFDAHRADFDALLASVRFTDADVPRAGAIEGTRFTHVASGCELNAPEGWTLSLGASREVFRLLLVPPAEAAEGKPSPDESRVVLFAQRIGRHENPEAAVTEYFEDSIRDFRRKVPGMMLLDDVRPVTTSQGTRGFEITLALPIEAMERVRKMAVFTANDHLFVMHCDAIPPTRFKQIEPEFDALIAGLALR